MSDEKYKQSFMNQNTLHEVDQTNCLENSNDSFFWMLTAKEKKLYKILSEITSETIIAISIRERLSCGSLGGFRHMIKELHEQSTVAKKELIRAIGSKAVSLIERISFVFG